MLSVGCPTPDHTFSVGYSVVENVDCVRDPAVPIDSNLNVLYIYFKVVSKAQNAAKPTDLSVKLKKIIWGKAPDSIQRRRLGAPPQTPPRNRHCLGPEQKSEIVCQNDTVQRQIMYLSELGHQIPINKLLAYDIYWCGR